MKLNKSAAEFAPAGVCTSDGGFGSLVEGTDELTGSNLDASAEEWYGQNDMNLVCISPHRLKSRQQLNAIFWFFVLLSRHRICTTIQVHLTPHRLILPAHQHRIRPNLAILRNHTIHTFTKMSIILPRTSPIMATVITATMDMV